ncbi:MULTISPECIES: nucleotide sugar dehydrogenase [Symbiopectobacterium]|uniref:nucleotide sugar dehydrogenase n=1 Tax=Symbiopectobacterium TaxID=801 RepID=UPI001A1EA420|nr:MULTISPECIES: nucleotide sugar dehydrogenase [Symbiopectobacterium]MBG6248409.1 nucleotide sugar dehydrogenase [Candidatus Symbiopectobacterium sp. PLON1]MBT9429852.1 nucleotide sugar dehydrogenase [Candidatus Symbiopectobacterium endolongispinus]
MDIRKKKIAVIGLGYVGLPLAAAFGKHRDVVGYDNSSKRIEELRCGIDNTKELGVDEINSISYLSFSNDINDLHSCDIFILTVPTPINSGNQPDFNPLISASEMIGKVMRKGAIVIYESTVFTGCTEDICVPILQKNSGLIFNETFFCGYSPERINPGDSERRLTNIRKITSGSTPDVSIAVDDLYNEIIKAGTFMTSSIKVAEAAKIIENVQRDVNIALVNELTFIFDTLELDIKEIFTSANTKWNFLLFKPGLVGGHCIGVDPYYLIYKAQEAGYYPELISAGRRVNNSMAKHIADVTIKRILSAGKSILKAKVLILGLTFKENCPDIRNTKVVDLFNSLKDYCMGVDIYDPLVNISEAEHSYNLKCLHSLPDSGNYSAIVIAVGHNEFVNMGLSKIKALGDRNAYI